MIQSQNSNFTENAEFPAENGLVYILYIASQNKNNCFKLPSI